MRIIIAESDGFSPAALSLLRDHASVRVPDGLDRPSLLRSIGDSNVLWVRLNHTIDVDVFDHAPRLQVVVSPTTGLDHIDLAEAGRRQVEVLSLQGEVEFLRDVRATAEHTIALIFALLRHLPSAVGHARSGGWSRDLFKGNELCGKTVGIVGLGRIGRLVARYLRAFEVDVLASDPKVEAAALPDGVQLVALDRLLREADLITVHADLSPEAEGMFGRTQFNSMRRGAWFINTSRGQLVDEASLLDALRSGQLAGAALDVRTGERETAGREHPLVHYAGAHDNLLLTPHIGGCTFESMEKTERFMAEKLHRHWFGSEDQCT